MGASITRGTTFTVAQQDVDVATFKPILTGATIVGIDRENTKANLSVATRDAEPPSGAQEREVWEDDEQNSLRTLISGQFVPATNQLVAYTLSELSAAASAGMALMLSQQPADDGTGKLELLKFGTQGFFVGIAAGDVDPGGSGFYVRKGPVRVKVSGTVNPGEPVVQSVTAGIGESGGAPGSSNTSYATAISGNSGGFAWANIRT